MKKIYTAIIIIALALFISCDDKKAKDVITKAIDEDAITKAIDETVAEADKGTSLANNVQGNTQSKTKTIQVIQGKVQVTEGEAGSTPEDTPEPESETPLTKPVLSAQRVRWETPITFQKVEGHTYRLKDNKQGFVSLGDVSENIHQVKATQVVVDVVVVATKGSEQIESDPIDFLLHVANKVALQAEIEENIKNYGNNVNLNYLDTSSITDMSSLFKGKASFNGDISKWDVSSVTNMVNMFHGATEFNGDISEWDVSSVTKMRFMFYKATKFNQDLSKWASKILGSVSRTNMFTGSGLERNKPSWW